MSKKKPRQAQETKSEEVVNPATSPKLFKELELNAKSEEEIKAENQKSGEREPRTKLERPMPFDYSCFNKDGIVAIVDSTIKEEDKIVVTSVIENSNKKQQGQKITMNIDEEKLVCPFSDSIDDLETIDSITLFVQRGMTDRPTPTAAFNEIINKLPSTLESIQTKVDIVANKLQGEKERNEIKDYLLKQKLNDKMNIFSIDELKSFVAILKVTEKCNINDSSLVFSKIKNVLDVAASYIYQDNESLSLACVLQHLRPAFRTNLLIEFTKKHPVDELIGNKRISFLFQLLSALELVSKNAFSKFMDEIKSKFDSVSDDEKISKIEKVLEFFKAIPTFGLNLPLLEEVEKEEIDFDGIDISKFDFNIHRSCSFPRRRNTRVKPLEEEDDEEGAKNG